MFRYLPVSAGDQTLGIPFAAIRQILMWSELPGSEAAEPQQDDLPSGEEVMMINLGQLLTGSDYDKERSQIIVVDSATQRIAIVVDSIAPLKTVEPGSYSVMPAIFGTRQTVFGGVIREQENLILLIDPDRISMVSATARDC